MAKYEVVRPWFGVKIGDVVELKDLHPALRSNVRLMKVSCYRMANSKSFSLLNNSRR